MTDFVCLLFHKFPTPFLLCSKKLCVFVFSIRFSLGMHPITCIPYHVDDVVILEFALWFWLPTQSKCIHHRVQVVQWSSFVFLCGDTWSLWNYPDDCHSMQKAVVVLPKEHDETSQWRWKRRKKMMMNVQVSAIVPIVLFRKDPTWWYWILIRRDHFYHHRMILDEYYEFVTMVVGAPWRRIYCCFCCW